MTNTTAPGEGRTLLDEVESKQLLEAAGIATSGGQRATSAAEAVRIADTLGYPAVLKVLSSQVAHKSDAGGVLLGLADAAAVRAGYERIIEQVGRAAPGAVIDGVSVQRQAPAGVEVIVGVSTDAQFGPVVMFGLGGVLVEVLRDVAFRVTPLTARDARELVREIKGFPVLQGYRGAPASDTGALERLLLQVSALVQARPDIEELDLNPVFAYPDGAVAVDARVVLAAL